MKVIGAWLALILLLSFVSCRKDHEVVIPPQKGHLSVNLAEQYLGAAQVDSAIATWTVGEEKNQVRMLVRNDSLIAELEQFREGNGTLIIQVFSNKKFGNQYKSQWLFQNATQINRKKDLGFEGPASFFDSGWKPRVDLTDAIGHRAIIGMRPDDAYFKIVGVGPEVKSLTVDKSYWKTTGGVQLAGQGIWKCSNACTDCSGNVENDEYFKMMPDHMKNAPWNHISLIVLYETNQTGMGWLLTLEFEP